MESHNDITSIKDALEKEGVVITNPMGDSMYPMLAQGKDSIVVKKLCCPPKENDVVLYLRDSGKYVLHRVIKVLPDGYVIRGDNCCGNEYDIKDRHLIGVLVGFYKKDKYVDCEKSKAYKAYIYLNRYTYYIRYPFRKLHVFLAKIKNKILKRH